MEYHALMFDIALLVIVGCLAEIYVRKRGLGFTRQKDRHGHLLPYTPQLGRPILLLIIAIGLAVYLS